MHRVDPDAFLARGAFTRDRRHVFVACVRLPSANRTTALWRIYAWLISVLGDVLPPDAHGRLAVTRPHRLTTNGTFDFCAPHPAAAIAAPPAHAPPIAIAFSGCVPAPINLGSWSIQQPTKLSAVLLPVKQSYPFLPRYSTAENKSQSIVWPPCASCCAARSDERTWRFCHVLSF